MAIVNDECTVLNSKLRRHTVVSSPMHDEHRDDMSVPQMHTDLHHHICVENNSNQDDSDDTSTGTNDMSSND